MSTLRLVICCALALAMTCAASGHPGHFYSAFHAETLPEACELAHTEHKLVFVYVLGPRQRACPFLVRPTGRDAPLLDLLVRETVMVVIDPATSPKCLAPYNIEQGPALLLLDATGDEQTRFPAELSSTQLVRKLAEQLATTATVARVREALSARGAEHYFTRERLARMLALAGDSDAALRAFTWCMRRSVAGKDPAALYRRRLLFQAFADFASRHAPARAVLDTQRAQIEEDLQSGRDNPILARDLAELNHYLDDDGRTLRLFDSLPEDCRARHGLFDRLLPHLVAARRYDDVLSYVRPRAAFRGEAQLARGRSLLWATAPGETTARGTRAFAVARGAALVESLAGTNRDAEARTLVDDILRFDDRAATRELLRSHARRANAPQLADYIARLPRGPQPAID